MKKISIITINLNNATGLRRTIESIFAQMFNNYELIVIDGGSVDESIDIINEYSSKIKKWVSEPDQGIYNAQNKGIVFSTGEYLLFLNSGDYLSNEYVLEKVNNSLPEADIIYGDMILIQSGMETYRKSPERITQFHMLKDTLWHPVSFIKRSLFERFGNYDEQFRIAGDYEFFARTIIKGKVSTKHYAFAISVFSPGGISTDLTMRDILIKERNRVQDKYFNPVLLKLFRAYSRLRN